MAKLENAEGRMIFLDFLRSIAIFFVLLTHYYGWFFPGGSIGVSIFFCLSGFLITNQLLNPKVSFRSFLIKRFLRIYPMS